MIVCAIPTCRFSVSTHNWQWREMGTPDTPNRYRAMGKYYEDMWAAAIDANPMVIAVTSYNEWGEGTQV